KPPERACPPWCDRPYVPWPAIHGETLRTFPGGVMSGDARAGKDAETGDAQRGAGELIPGHSLPEREYGDDIYQGETERRKGISLAEWHPPDCCHPEQGGAERRGKRTDHPRIQEQGSQGADIEVLDCRAGVQADLPLEHDLPIDRQ